jgi:hypothetical protein
MGDGPNHELLTSSIDLSREVIRHVFGFPKDEDNLQHLYGEVIQPIADAIEQELERSLVPDFEDTNVFPEFQFRELLAGDPLTRAKLHQTKVLSGQETVNEAREAENLPALPGGDVANLPLNVIPINASPADRNPPKKDTAGGLGGAEGRGTIPRIAQGQRDLKAAAEDLNPEGDLRLRAAQGNWRTVRTRVLKGQAEALERRLRGALNGERDGLREMLGPLGHVPARVKLQGSVFSNATVQATMTRTDTELGGLLERAMISTAGAAATQARALLSDEGEAVPVLLDQVSQDTIRARVANMVGTFGQRRQEAFDRLVEQELNDGRTLRHTDDSILGTWGKLGDHLVRMIGENETAWAFERGAVVGWGTASIDEVAVVKAAGECSTGICLDVVAHGRYRLGDVPTPLHPGCHCMAMPTQLVEGA